MISSSDELVNDNENKCVVVDTQVVLKKKKEKKSQRYVVLDSVRCDCGARYYKFKGKTSNGAEFNEIFRLSAIGDAIREPGLDISYWDDGGFFEVVIELIALKIKIGFDEYNGNIYPTKIARKYVNKLKNALNRLLMDNNRDPLDSCYVYKPLSEEEKNIRTEIYYRIREKCTSECTN